MINKTFGKTSNLFDGFGTKALLFSKRVGNSKRF